MSKKSKDIEAIEKLKIHLAIAEQNKEKVAIANLKRLIAHFEKKLKNT